MEPLSPREIEILDCLVTGWAEGEMGLYGGLSYQDVIDFCARMGAAPPTKMIERINALQALCDKHGVVVQIKDIEDKVATLRNKKV